MRSRSLLSLVVVLVLAGCDSATTVDPPAAPPPVLPLAVGTEWTLARAYTVRYDEDGAAEDTTRQAEPSLYTLAVTRDSAIAGETWFLVEAPRGVSHCVFSQSVWMTNREDGLYRLRPDTGAPERAYATGVDEGVPFLETDLFTAVLADDDATFELPAETVPVRQYDRTWRRLEVSESVRGPIEPMPVTRDQLSSTRGPVALEIVYVQSSSADDDRFRPTALVRYERTEAAVPATARRAAAETGDAFAVR